MKLTLSIALTLAVTSFVNAYDPDIVEVEANFNAEHIVPDVLSSVDFKLLLDLTFTYNSSGVVTKTGLNLTQPGKSRPRGVHTLSTYGATKRSPSYHPFPFAILRPKWT
jgi:hypothetical protein